MTNILAIFLAVLFSRVLAKGQRAPFITSHTSTSFLSASRNYSSPCRQLDAFLQGVLDRSSTINPMLKPSFSN
ncbi:hypothetical protein ColTof4_14407 [Colletotrichum tofieldiae]|nr:hypothetical protein ColTof3_14873 [Colletotrichum tofieldiae]GKT81984.1 hypothetical protein ColTof4_14407 [Colletotrichum tofieldiae]